MRCFELLNTHCTLQSAGKIRPGVHSSKS